MYVSGSLSRQNYLCGGLRSALVLVWRLTFSWEPAEVASASGTTGTAPFVCWPGGKAALLCSAVPVSRGLRACGISTLFTWKTWCLWFSTSVFPGWWHQSKGLCDLTVSAAFTCELGTHRVAPLASIYSAEREQKGTGLPRVTQQRCRQLFTVHSTAPRFRVHFQPCFLLLCDKLAFH